MSYKMEEETGGQLATICASSCNQAARSPAQRSRSTSAFDSTDAVFALMHRFASLTSPSQNVSPIFVSSSSSDCALKRKIALD